MNNDLFEIKNIDKMKRARANCRLVDLEAREADEDEDEEDEEDMDQRSSHHNQRYCLTANF